MEVLTDAALIEQVKEYTKSSPERIAGMIAAVRRIDQDEIPGAVVECGVWKGGNIILVRKLSPRRVCWLYDTFAGMTKPEEVDVNRSGMKATELYPLKTNWQAVSVEEVRQVLFETDTLDERKLRFVVGDVTETLLDSGFNLPRKIALLRLDTDWHASTKIELEVLYPLLQPGGVLIVDDYGHWQGARKAVDDYFGNDARIEMIDYTAAMMVKPPC